MCCKGKVTSNLLYLDEEIQKEEPYNTRMKIVFRRRVFEFISFVEYRVIWTKLTETLEKE